MSEDPYMLFTIYEKFNFSKGLNPDSISLKGGRIGFVSQQIGFETLAWCFKMYLIVMKSGSILVSSRVQKRMN